MCQCNYNATESTGHSQIIGWGLDGRGLYGKWESAGKLPTLDTCGGHVGATPAYTFVDSTGRTVTIPAQTSAYHYHIVAGGPQTIGCFGGPGSKPSTGSSLDLAGAKALYSSCNTGFTTYCTAAGSITYDIDCTPRGIECCWTDFFIRRMHI